MLFTETYNSPIGRLLITASEQYIQSITFIDTHLDGLCPNVLTNTCCIQLGEYFNFGIEKFNLPLASDKGTEFQRRVWSALQTVPFSQTLSYSAIATQIGAFGAQQAVGQACKSNPWVIVVPCHRVLSASGALSGYAYGLARKKALLDHEIMLTKFQRNSSQ